MLLKWVDATGRSVVGFLRYVFLLAAFLYLSCKTVWIGRHLGHRDFRRETLHQVYFTGVQAMAPVILVALGVGVIAIAQGVGGVGVLSGTEGLGRLVTLLLVRELAPLLTGIVLIVRSVTAVSAQLGLMRISREVEAIEVMGIPPMRHLIAPRLLGGVLASFGLSVLAAASALVGGFAVSRLLVSLPADVFFGAVLSATSRSDVLSFGIKTIGGGLGMFLIACLHGMDVERSPTQVPVAVSKAALHALVFLLVLHAAIDIWDLLHVVNHRIPGGLL